MTDLEGKSPTNSDPLAETSSVGASLSGTQSNQTMEISRISVKAPPFWRANPALWFCQLEAQFEMNRITADKSKYYTVVAAIESTVLHQVSDLVLNPPVSGLYVALKKRLLDVFADSEQSKIKKLLGEIELGDQKPSFLLREMKNLAGNSIPADLLRTLWLQRLPSNMQAILSVSSEDVDRLVVMADKIHETSMGSEIHKVSIHKANDHSPQLSLENQVAELSRQISELKSAFSRNSTKYDSNSRRSNDRSKSRSRSQTPGKRHANSNTHYSSEPKLCWYHQKWGNKANTCVGQCDFKSTTATSGN